MRNTRIILLFVLAVLILVFLLVVLLVLFAPPFALTFVVLTSVLRDALYLLTDNVSLHELSYSVSKCPLLSAQTPGMPGTFSNKETAYHPWFSLFERHTEFNVLGRVPAFGHPYIVKDEEYISNNRIFLIGPVGSISA